jgi:hypothetical protein
METDREAGKAVYEGKRNLIRLFSDRPPPPPASEGIDYTKVEMVEAQQGDRSDLRTSRQPRTYRVRFLTGLLAVVVVIAWDVWLTLRVEGVL